MSGARNARKQETDHAKDPRNGAGAPSLRALLLGTPVHRDSHARQLQAAIMASVPGIFSAGRDELIRQCADSRLFYEIVRSLWTASISCVGKKSDIAGAENRFGTSIKEGWLVLRRTVGVHSAIDADLDLGFVDRQEKEMRDLLTALLSDRGDDDARLAYVDLAWQHARDRVPGEEDLLYGAVGASLYANEAWRFKSWNPTGGSTDFIGCCIELGRQAITGTLPQAEPAWATEAKAKAGLRAIEAARAEAGPSLMVLVSVDHLPGSATSGEGRPGGSVGTTARAEWAPMAGKKLPSSWSPIWPV